MSIVFGPIPSRRLGRSLGINNVPFKYCTYSCVYCQLGLTNSMIVYNRDFYSSKEVFKAVKSKLRKLTQAGEKVDYLSFVPDGEPTLDKNLGTTIEKLKKLGIKIAAITNSSLLFDKNVRDELKNADWVSLKIDTVNPATWKEINRPQGCLKLEAIIDGMKTFASEFKGELVTETMLVKSINDKTDSIYKTAETVKMVNPRRAYILVPTRPPAEKYVTAPDEDTLNKAYQIFKDLNIDTELLTHFEGNEFTYSSDLEKELLSILAVHPMRIDSVRKFIEKSNSKWGVVDELINSKKIKEVIYNNNSYFISTNRI